MNSAELRAVADFLERLTELSASTGVRIDTALPLRLDCGLLVGITEVGGVYCTTSSGGD